MRKIDFPLCLTKSKKLYQELFDNVRIKYQESEKELENAQLMLRLLDNFKETTSSEKIIIEQELGKKCLECVYIEKDSIYNDFMFYHTRYYIGKQEDVFFMELKLNFSSRCCEVINWNVLEINKGYGTQAIERLKKLCLFLDINIIMGKIIFEKTGSKEDIEYNNRLLHFYKKNGFIITDTVNTMEKIIKYEFINSCN